MAKTTPQARAALALTEALTAVLDNEQTPSSSEAIRNVAAYIRAAAQHNSSNKRMLLDALAAAAVNMDAGPDQCLHFFICNHVGRFMGATVHAEDAAAMVALLGEGATVRCNVDSILWTEGSERELASESYDGAAEIMLERMGSKRS